MLLFYWSIPITGSKETSSTPDSQNLLCIKFLYNDISIFTTKDKPTAFCSMVRQRLFFSQKAAQRALYIASVFYLLCHQCLYNSTVCPAVKKPLGHYFENTNADTFSFVWQYSQGKMGFIERTCPSRPLASMGLTNIYLIDYPLKKKKTVASLYQFSLFPTDSSS